MKAASGINASSSDKAFGVSAGASAASGQGSSGVGFLAMLDGLIQAGGAGQGPSGQNAGAFDQGKGVAANASADTAPSDDEADAQDEIALAAETDPAAAVPASAQATALLSKALVVTPIASQPVAAKSATVSAATPADGAALATLAVQAGIVPVLPAVPAPANNDITIAAAPVSAPVQLPIPAATLTATPVVATTQIVPANNSQPVAASAVQTATVTALPVAPAIAVTSDAPVAAPDNTAEKSVPSTQTSQQSDQQNSDSQQSAILSALFALAPLQVLPAITPVSSAESSSAKPVSGLASSLVSNGANTGTTSVPGVGIPPTLPPQAAVGNGAPIMVSHVLLAANSDNSAATPSFGIGANALADSGASASDSDADNNTVSATPAAANDQAKAETIASLFAAPTVAPKTEKLPDDNTASNTVSGVTAYTVDVGTTGLTLVHQSTTTGVANSATITASATVYASPAEQVSVAMSKAASTGAQSMTIALNPIELGKVEVKLDFAKDGSVQASVTAERPETLTLLKNDHSTLTQALHNAGLTTDSNSLSFNLRDGGNAHQQQGFGSASSYRPRAANVDAEDTVSPSSTTTVQYAVSSGNGRLDVRV